MNDEVSGAATLPAVPTGAQISLYDLLPEELEAWLAARKQPLFRAKQLYAGTYGHFAAHAATIPAVPKALGALIDAGIAIGDPRRRDADDERRRADDETALAHGGRLHDRGRSDALSRPLDRLHLLAGGLRLRLHLLRDGQDGPDAQSVGGRDRRAGRRPRPIE